MDPLWSPCGPPMEPLWPSLWPLCLTQRVQSYGPPMPSWFPYGPLGPYGGSLWTPYGPLWTPYAIMIPYGHPNRSHREGDRSGRRGGYIGHRGGHRRGAIEAIEGAI